MARRHSDYQGRNSHLATIRAEEKSQNKLNAVMKIEIEENIKEHTNKIQQDHYLLRAGVKEHTVDHAKMVQDFRKADLTNKQHNVSNMYQ